MTSTDTSNLDAPVPAVRPPSPEDAWLSRRHWRRAMRGWALGTMDRAEFDALKARLARVRAGDAPPPRAAAGAGAAPLRLLLGGRAARPPGMPPTVPRGPARAA